MRKLFLASAMLVAVSGCDQSEQRVAIHDNVRQPTSYVAGESLKQVTAEEAGSILSRRSFKTKRIISNFEQDLADYIHQHGETHFEERVRLLQTEGSLSRAQAVAQVLGMPELLEFDRK